MVISQIKTKNENMSTTEIHNYLERNSTEIYVTLSLFDTYFGFLNLHTLIMLTRRNIRLIKIHVFL